MKKLIVTIGAPGSGKTTWANERCRKLLGKTIMVSLDDLRVTLFGNITKREFFDRVTNPEVLPIMKRLLEEMVTVLSKSIFVEEIIVCNTNTNIDTVKDWYKLSRKLGMSFHYKTFQLSDSELLKRNKTRPKEDRVPKEALLSMNLYGKSAIKKVAKVTKAYKLE